jgi:hypothetical protein
VKTGLLVVGVAGGVFLAAKLFLGKKSAPTKTAASSGSTLNSLIQSVVPSLTSGLSHAFSGFGSTSSSSSTPSFVQSVDTQAQQSYAVSHGVVDLQGNQLIDLNTGNALDYGVN